MTLCVLFHSLNPYPRIAVDTFNFFVGHIVSLVSTIAPAGSLTAFLLTVGITATLIATPFSLAVTLLYRWIMDICST